ncbi:MAG: hypothetical protein F6K16_38440 [Symploca sp. SIO2B6]|nr:hypothetical protein [Symploca sp. SIO2B6]
MMNITEMTANSIHTLQTVETEAPDLPTLDLPPNALDPANPLAWVLCLTLLLGNTDEVINAIAKLLRAIASLNSSKANQDESDT